jgi:SSS family solute:Na+ symporter
MFTMTVWDWSIVALYVVFCIAVGLILKRRGERHGMQSYVAADRSMPWWLLGTSMVATTFAAETPLLISNWVYESGISRNWEWWCFLPGAMLTTFLFARLWRRTEVLTDAEYVTIRYSGTEAKVLRGFRALYMGLIVNTFMIGGQFLVSGMIGTAVLGVSETNPHYKPLRIVIPLICAAVAMTSSSLAGISGILVTDFVLFILKLFGAIVICIYALAQPQVGGLHGLLAQLSGSRAQYLDVLPHDLATQSTHLGILTIALYLTTRWWIQVYGGAEPGGGSYVVQRILSAKSEKHALYATLWFNIAYYAVRPWPWIITGLACILLYPKAARGEDAYIQCINLVPAGLKGVVLAAFFAALMAIDTRLNLGAAYLVNDFYRPFLVKGKSERHYVFVSRLATCAQVGLGLIYATQVTRVKTAFYLTTAIGSGTGLVYALRWYWWRINAWSEIAALAAGLCNLILFRFFIFPSEQQFNAHGVQVLLWSGVLVSSVWIGVTLLTKPSDRQQLKKFYAKVRPAGPFWGPIAREVKHELGPIDPGYSVGRGLTLWITATAMVLCILFGSGKLLLGEPWIGTAILLLGLVLCIALRWSLRKGGALVEQSLSSVEAPTLVLSPGTPGEG